MFDSLNCKETFLYIYDYKVRGLGFQSLDPASDFCVMIFDDGFQLDYGALGDPAFSNALRDYLVDRFKIGQYFSLSDYSPDFIFSLINSRAVADWPCADEYEKIEFSPVYRFFDVSCFDEYRSSIFQKIEKIRGVLG